MGKVTQKTSQYTQNGPKIFDYFVRKDNKTANQSMNNSSDSLTKQSPKQTISKSIDEKNSPKSKSTKRKNESESELVTNSKKRPKKLILLSDSEEDMNEEIDRSKSSINKSKLDNNINKSKVENVVKEKKLKKEKSVQQKEIIDKKERKQKSKQSLDSTNDEIKDKKKSKTPQKSVKNESKAESTQPKTKSPQKQVKNELIIEKSERKPKTPQKSNNDELIVEKNEPKRKTPQKTERKGLSAEKTEPKPKTPQKMNEETEKIKLKSKQSPIKTNINNKSNDTKSNSSFSCINRSKPQTKQLNESNMWVDKYRPLNSKLIIGQQGEKSCVNKLIKWLSNWHLNYDKKPGFGKWASDEGIGFKAALLSGPPGIGKTTSAQLVCKELGFDFCELNASDSRNKKSLQEEVKELLGNTTLTNYFNSSDTNKNCSVSTKHVVIMDEVDGMAGNEDRGGVAELIQLIKTTKVPIICICNDRSHPKMRSLVNYCFDLRFYKPRIEQIKGPMMSIAYKEGIQVAPNVLHELIVSSNQDIRQVLHNLSLLSTGAKRIDNLLSERSIKDIKLGPFDAVKKVFTSGEEYARMSFQDKSDLFFCDYSIMPLFVFENYANVTPSKKGSEAEKLKLATKAIDAMAFGDIIEKEIRTNNNWSLLPLQAAFSSVMPGNYMNGHLSQQISFPAFMGKMSTTNKRNRLLNELKMHMNLKVSGSKSALNLDYLEPLRDSIIGPLIANGTGGVPEAIEKLESYCLRREDIESIIELTLWDNQTDPMSKVDAKTKAALTRAYNKEGFALPYSLGTVKKGRKTNSNDFDVEIDGEEPNDELNDNMEEDNDNDNIDLDAMIKAKKTSKKSPKKKTETESKRKTSAKKSKKSEIEFEPKSKRKESKNSSKGKANEKK